MQLISRELLFDIMSHKKKVTLSESETAAFETFKKKADDEYKIASDTFYGSIRSQYEDEMEMFIINMLKFMNDNQD